MAPARRRRYLNKAERTALLTQWRDQDLDVDEIARRFRQDAGAGGLESYRLANNLSQLAVGLLYNPDEGGATAQVVSRWEQWPNGHNPIQPSLLVLGRLATIYHTTRANLVAAIDERRPGHQAGASAQPFDVAQVGEPGRRQSHEISVSSDWPGLVSPPSDPDLRAHRFRQPTSAGGVGAGGLESYRLANDLSQTDVAAEYTARYGGGVSASIVSRWEAWPHGHRPIQPALLVLQRLATIYHTTRVNLVGAIDHTTTPNLVAAILGEDPSAEADQTTRELLRFTPESTGLGVGDDDLHGTEPEDLAQVLETSNVGPVTLAQLEETVAHLGQELPRKSPFELRSPIQGYLRRVTILLRQPQPPAMRRALCSTAAQLAGLAGNVEFDLYRPGRAQALYAVALEAAAQAEDLGVSAWVLGNTSYLLAERGEPERALQAAQRAASLVSKGLVTTQHVWLAVLEAELHASLGDVRSVEAALQRADQAMREARLQERRRGIDFFTEAKLPAYKASCYMLVGLAKPALEHSTAALDQLAPDARSRSFVLLDHATILAQLGHLDQARRIVTAFLTATPVHIGERTPRLVRRVQDFRRILGPASSSSAAGELEEPLRIWLNHQSHATTRMGFHRG